LDDFDLRRLRNTLAAQQDDVDQIQVSLKKSRHSDGRRVEHITITRCLRHDVTNAATRRGAIVGSPHQGQWTMKAYGRTETIDKALRYFHERKGALIVEIGSIRQRGNINGDGYSTVAWSQHAKTVFSVDIDPAATALTREETAEFGNVRAITQDGVEF